MQALILAAGTGSRLRPYTNEVPKCMVKADGVPMIKRAFDAILEAGIRKIVVGLGYKAAVLKNYLDETFYYEIQNGLEINYVENPDFEKTNNIYSLYLAKDFFCRDDTILLESDLVYDKKIIGDLKNDNGPNMAVVSKFESWMDGTVTKLDRNGNITEFILKKNQKDEERQEYYKTVNIYKFSKDFINKFYLPFLEAFMKVYGKNEYYETSLEILAKFSPTLLKGFKVNPELWHEIDNPDDLKAAEKKIENFTIACKEKQMR